MSTAPQPLDQGETLSINLEKVLDKLDRLVLLTTNKSLNTLQVMIIRGVWAGETYEAIAQQSSWSEAHVKMVGSQLWELLSEVLREPVRKKSVRAILERHYRDWLINEPPSALPQSDSSSLEFPDGPVSLTSNYYVARPPIESRCYEMVTQPGALIRIRAPRQMGKTSLLNRIVRQSEDLGYNAITLHLHLVDTEILQDLDRFLQWFCGRVTQRLNLSLQIADYWDDIFGSKTSCKDYFESYLLPNCQQPLVLALDEVDVLFNYPDTADGFFALLRAWYEDAKNNPLWQIVRLVLVHSTDAYIPLNINQSPFNVGVPIELPEFTVQQIENLVERHGLCWTDEQIQPLVEMLGGHPYLIRLALYHLAQTSMNLEDLLSTALSPQSPFFSHLQYLTQMVEQNADWMDMLQSMVVEQPSIHLKPKDLCQLTRLGLIAMRDGQMQIRCGLYRHWLQGYF